MAVPRSGALLAAGLVSALASCTGATGPAAVDAAPPPPPSGPPVTVAVSGDIAQSRAGAEQTARIVESIDPDLVLTTGDNAYPEGRSEDYARRYDPTWGRFKDRTRPTPGNHEYETPGARGYFEYFAGQVQGRPYYAHDAGAWRLYALNTEIDMSAGSPQERWLREDLATNARGRNVLAYLHSPYYTCSTRHRPERDVRPLWTALSEAGAELLLAGHNHSYERFEKRGSDDRPAAGGLRHFVVGTGGADLYPLNPTCPGREAAQDRELAVLTLTLTAGDYRWQLLGTRSQVLDEGGEAVSPAPR